MDLSDRIALVYAEDLMKFIMRQRNLRQWRSALGTGAFEDEAKGHFPFVMGVAVEGIAKGIVKDWMHYMREHMLHFTRLEGLESYIRRFVRTYFNQFGHNPTITIRMMTFMVEASVLLYLNHVEDAPLQGMRILSRFIQEVVPNREDILGGLEHLRQWAFFLINDPESRISENFVYGKFYGEA